MKRSGVFSLITYILYTLFWGAATLLIQFGLLSQDDILQLGVGVLFLVIAEFYTITMAIGSLFMVIIKILHMCKGWIVCGILCLLADIRMVWIFAASIISVGAINGVTFVLLVPLVLAVGSLISNIRSLKN